MPVTCTPEALAEASTCFLDLPWRTRQAIRVYLLCAYINGDTVDCDPNALATAATCYLASLSAAQLDAIETYLLCQLASAPAGGGDVSGPGLSTDNAIVRWNGAGGTAVQNSGITIADGASGSLSGTNTGDQSTIYSADGSLTSNRIVTCTGFTLSFVSIEGLDITDSGPFNILNCQDDGYVSWGGSGSTYGRLYTSASDGEAALIGPTKLRVVTPAVFAGGGGLSVGMSLKLTNTSTGQCEWQ